MVAVAECSTHAVLDAVIGGFKDSECIVSDALDAHVGTDRLLLADRGLWGLARWHRLRDQGTHLLWRIERRKARRVQDVLPDGSYLARIEANKHSKAARTLKAPPALVRVNEYRVDGQTDIVRLITSLTDHERYPAAELAPLYTRRWEIELVFDEIKTHQRGRPVLRSQTPDGARQEIYAHLIVHHAARELLDEVARLHQSTAERTSFTRALYVVRRTVISPSGFAPSARRRDRRLSLNQIGHSLLPRRRARDCPRKIRSCVTGYGSKAPGEPASHRRSPIVVTLNHRWHDHQINYIAMSSTGERSHAGPGGQRPSCRTAKKITAVSSRRPRARRRRCRPSPSARRSSWLPR
ncbi:IS4 family transposase [Streptomyces sp. x-80]|uniref:IS4 family transposase n=1 Tax=Streptomyces sp. x-80 TaxID=2789282 RepID=UPI003980B468